MYLKSWWYGLQFLRIRVWQTKIGNYGSVFGLLTNTLHPAKIPQNQNLEKMEKLLEISFYTCVTKTTIIWGMVSEIKWDRQIFLSVWAIFGPFTPPSPHPQQPSKSKFWKNKKCIWYTPFIYVYQNSWSYGVCFLRYGCNTQFSIILIHFLPFYSTIGPKD